MIRATEVKAAGTWHGEPADTVVLEFDDRNRRRFAMKGVKGLDFLLDLEETVALRTGDGLKLENGFIVEVVGKPESLMEIATKNPDDIVRIAWHLGNRHLPVQIAGKKLRIRADHVIGDMLKGLGCKVVNIETAFDPEGGAYVHAPHDHEHHGHDHHDHAGCCGGKHDHGHDHHHHGEGCCGGKHAEAKADDHHGHDHHGHDHHTHDHAHKHEHDHGHDHHEHGKGCGCGHHHGHKHD